MFFRVDANLDVAGREGLGQGGGEIFEYNSQFASELTRLGLLSVEDFAANAPSPAYLPQLTWDPATAQFWTNFQSAELHTIHYGGDWMSGTGQDIAYNYRLENGELAIFLTNGFIVSERLGSPTFGDAYYRLFNADLPVFITTDSVLHAWHRSFVSMLGELEESVAYPLLERMLPERSSTLLQLWQQDGQGPSSSSILDADYFLTVARSLVVGRQVPTTLGIEDQKVTETLAAIDSQQLRPFPLFGSERVMDFSQFKPRGHYDTSDTLRRYFRAMMWCGRVDLRVATFEPNREDDIRQLGTAIVLSKLLWVDNALEKMTRLFFGVTDSMTPMQLRSALGSMYLDSSNYVPDPLTLATMQTSLLTGSLGVQDVSSDFLWSPFSAAQAKLPRSFTVLGQKFTLDSWALSQVVFDHILWDPVDPRTLFGKVVRRKPTCLDIAYSVLGNDQVVPEITSRITDTNGVPFRDGLPYQHNLLAVRNTVDHQKTAVWQDNLYSAWLAALRSLSAPTTDPKYPEAMRTRAWAMKNLNTQLASWTQLRHDTVLYAKQSYTSPVLCSYPAGFVEPRPEFWASMNTLASVAARGIGEIAMGYPSAVATTNQLRFLTNFSSQMRVLEAIARKELAQQPLSATEKSMLENVVERSIDYVGVKRWTGWYPSLFYTNVVRNSKNESPGCDLWDPLVTDVHTDLPDDVVMDPGAVIHEAVGNVHLMLIAVDNGPDRAVYAGPVLSHYEFEMPIATRLSDVEWKHAIKTNQQPASPDWTRSYLVPGRIVIPNGYD